MARSRPLHLSWPLFVLCVVLGCSSRAHYGPEQDVEALSRIVGRWASADGAVTLTLCEDVETAQAEPADGCGVEHVARGDGSGPAHETEYSNNIGCGGCQFAAVAYVRGTLVRDGRERPVRGEVWLGDGSDADPYALPYRLELDCEEATDTRCGAAGTLDEEARMALTLEEGGSTTPAPALRLAGPAPCGG